MNYCDTFHCACLLDPFYLAGAVIWLFIEAWLIGTVLVVFGIPALWVLGGICNIIAEVRQRP